MQRRARAVVAVALSLPLAAAPVIAATPPSVRSSVGVLASLGRVDPARHARPGLDAVAPPVMPDAPNAALPPPPGTTRLESRKIGGGPGSGPSAEASLSLDGRWIAFSSRAADLVAGDTNQTQDVFLRDRRTGQTRIVTLPNRRPVPAIARAFDPAISGYGRYVAFTYQPPVIATTGAVAGSIVLVWDRVTGTTAIGSKRANGRPAFFSFEPALSRDGRFLAFTSTASGIVDNDSNEAADVFRIAWRGDTPPVLVSVDFQEGKAAPGDSGAPSISADGRYVAFRSDAGDGIVDEDTGAGRQVYVRDITAKRTEWLTPATDGGGSDGEADLPSISGNGRLVAFSSTATDLVAGDANGQPDVFVRDRTARTTTLVSVDVGGTSSAGASGQPSISADGRVVAFTSLSDDLVALAPGGIVLAAVVAGRSEIYARDLGSKETIRISEARTGGPGGAQNVAPVVSRNGRYVGWASTSPTLTNDPDNKLADVFVRDLPPVAAVNPAVLDFGGRAVSVAAVPAAATVSNSGWTPLAVTRVAITGPARTDFRTLADGCRGTTLRRGQTCTVTVGFTPSRSGNRIARLEVTHGASGSPGTVRLRGTGSQASLTLDPPMGAPGVVTTVEGRGFPAGSVVHLTWDRGIPGRIHDVTVNASGRFRIQVLIFHHDQLGIRDLVASAVDGTFPSVEARMQVVAGPAQPPTFGILRLLRGIPPAFVYRR